MQKHLVWAFVDLLISFFPILFTGSLWCLKLMHFTEIDYNRVNSSPLPHHPWKIYTLESSEYALVNVHHSVFILSTITSTCSNSTSENSAQAFNLCLSDMIIKHRIWVKVHYKPCVTVLKLWHQVKICWSMTIITIITSNKTFSPVHKFSNYMQFFWKASSHKSQATCPSNLTWFTLKNWITHS